MSNQQAEVILSVETRNGRNATWICSNISPETIFKTRRLSVSVPATRCEYSLTLECKVIRGVPSGEYCYLSIAELGADTEHKILKNFPNGSPKGSKVTFFIKTFSVRKEFSGKPEYRITLSFTTPESHTVIHAWTTKPIRNHKWESSPKGKLCNSKNAKPKKVTVSFSSNFALEDPIPKEYKLDNIPLFYEDLYIIQ